MQEVELFHEPFWRPLATYGFDHPLFTINKKIIFYTWIVLALIFILCLPVRYLLNKRFPLTRQLILSLVRSLMGITEQTFGKFMYNHCIFISSIFLFIFMCSAIIVIPGMEEPTQNLNTTLALGIISFLYIQAYAIKSHGLIPYIKEYFQPFIFGIPNIFLFPLHLVGKLASVVSISFRLFGNIFGGATISALFFGAIKGSLVGESLGLIMNICVLLPFGLFEGFLQAFVFSMLTITYLSLELKEEAEPFSEAVTW